MLFIKLDAIIMADIYNQIMTDQNHWHHSPVHKCDEAGTYMITAGTYKKQRFLNSHEKLQFVQDSLFEIADELGWRLQAWSILSNHYHFIAISPGKDAALTKFIGKFHTTNSKRLNHIDGTPGSKVWFQYWDSKITFQGSYLTRLNYVHYNPVHHGVAGDAVGYRWCSACWFQERAEKSFYQSVREIKTDRLKVIDDF